MPEMMNTPYITIRPARGGWFVEMTKSNGTGVSEWKPTSPEAMVVVMKMLALGDEY